jgi:tight adherence protein B
MKRLAVSLGLVLLTVAIAASVASAAELRLSQARGGHFPDRAFLLSLASRATLAPSQVSVTENSSLVSGVSFEPASSVGQSRFGTVLLIDTSWSMNGAAIRDAVAAANTFVQTRNPGQPVGIIFFSESPQIAVPLTRNTATLQSALTGRPQLHSGTRIFDAASAALQMLARAHIVGGSVILLSDGQDTGSHTSEQALATAASAQGVRVYTIGVRDYSFVGSTLQSLASATNGVYQPVTSAALVQLYRGLGLALSNQYLIRYRSIASLGQHVMVSVSVVGLGAASTSYSTPALPPGGTVTSLGRTIRATFWTSTLGAIVVVIGCAMLLGLALLLAMSHREGVRVRIASFVSSSVPIAREARQRTLVQRALGDVRLRRRERSPWFDALALELDVARIQFSPAQILLATVAGTILLGWLLVAATSSPLALPLGLAVPIGVRFVIQYLANRQRRLFEEQLPDNLQVIASALRAGHTFIGALGVMVEDAPEPSRRDLRRALADEQLGVPLVDALSLVSQRMRSLDFQQVTLVASLQRDTGGNTAEVIDVVTDTIRDRLDLRRLVRSLTAQGRLAGTILSGLPVGLLIAVSLINPHYVHPLFHKTIGIIALVAAGIMVISGSLIIRRIVNIEI